MEDIEAFKSGKPFPITWPILDDYTTKEQLSLIKRIMNQLDRGYKKDDKISVYEFQCLLMDYADLIVQESYFYQEYIKLKEREEERKYEGCTRD